MDKDLPTILPSCFTKSPQSEIQVKSEVPQKWWARLWYNMLVFPTVIYS
ncbi:hypothetical protein Pan241w_52820 [Gimesia alba]|uniref:Uncharacterized protein n=1 Tax=Gimesia alba TaxID=2527973 RepID=A0A517RMR0_9PLAN|nr:hypothetical protein Pan241w_52820 [Gimesia alba]